MKWKSKGHEFDGVYENIKHKKKFYLLGAGHDGIYVYDVIRKRHNNIEVCGFIDNDMSKQGKEYCGLKVLSLDEIDFTEEIGVVISIAASVTKELERKLISYGLKKGIDFYHYYVFLSVLSAYEKNEIFIPTISFLPSTRCNLRCKACLNFTTYIKQFKERAWDDVKEDIDLFFKHVDCVGLFHISGGEPLLCSYIGKLIEYISINYGDKIISLETVTNGTVVPSKEFLDSFRKYEITITVDDYRETLPQYKEQFDRVVFTLEQNKGRGKVIIKKYDEWLDLLPDASVENTSQSEDELVNKYNACHVPWQEYKEGKLYNCNYAAYAVNAEIITEDDYRESYNLKEHNKSKLKELMEFRLGYSEKGYAEFCKKCAGFLEINENKVIPALQKR